MAFIYDSAKLYRWERLLREAMLNANVSLTQWKIINSAVKGHDYTKDTTYALLKNWICRIYKQEFPEIRVHPRTKEETKRALNRVRFTATTKEAPDGIVYVNSVRLDGQLKDWVSCYEQVTYLCKVFKDMDDLECELVANNLRGKPELYFTDHVLGQLKLKMRSLKHAPSKDPIQRFLSPNFNPLPASTLDLSELEKVRF